MLGVFAGFWLSYAFLLLGLTHNWFGIGLVDVKSTLELFLTAWIVDHEHADPGHAAAADGLHRGARRSSTWR